MLSIAAVSSDSVTCVRRSFPWSLAISLMLHLFIATMFLRFSGAAHPTVAIAWKSPAREPPPRLVFVVSPSGLIGRGGGGGGNGQPEPIRRAESRGTDRITLRIAKPIATSGRAEAPPDLQGIVLDAKPLASGFLEQLGLPAGGVTFGTSMGPGTGQGVGTGTGRGIGSGRGPGLGEGTGGGAGGGVFRAGGPVTAPQILHEVRPTYTVGALEQRIQGSVVLELVVTEKGLPSQIRVIRSVDSRGLDQEAIKAVEQWKFAPGRMSGLPVPVLVRVILDFSIR